MSNHAAFPFYSLHITVYVCCPWSMLGGQKNLGEANLICASTIQQQPEHKREKTYD
jgi:hypothetical protein